MSAYTRGLPHEPPQKPERPQFSSGPTAKFPGWSLDKLETASLGRSHPNRMYFFSMNRFRISMWASGKPCARRCDESSKLPVSRRFR